MIKDSGNRHSFDTGAVRDIQEGKGRPTLMPLRVVARMLCEYIGGDEIFSQIASFTEDCDTAHLYQALRKFATLAYDGHLETMILETAKHFEDGAKKYGEHNWQKGIPVNCYLDSAIRHYLKFQRGDNDEPHDRAFVWNIMCCIWEVDYHDDKT
jgi:hypothetical protein